MALVRAVRRGGRAVLVGGHGFGSLSSSSTTARPLGAWDRASRAVGCAGPSTALDPISAAAATYARRISP